MNLGRRRGARQLQDTDLFHLHWPEWMFGEDLAAAEQFCTELDRHEVRLVWTQHNLVPHLAGDEAAFARLYELMAERAVGVVHHTESNRVRVVARWPFRPDAVHAVAPHGHWGELMHDVAGVDRAAVERDLGLRPLPPGGLRLGVVGAPRKAKRTGALMEAFARTDRDDLQLLVLSLEDDDVAPVDDRIAAFTYAYVDRATYNERLAVIDVLALPFEPDGASLTTGVVADAVGLGRPALVSSWRFLEEALGAAGIPMGDSVDEMTAAITALTPEIVARAADAARRAAGADVVDGGGRAHAGALRGGRHREGVGTRAVADVITIDEETGVATERAGRWTYHWRAPTKPFLHPVATPAGHVLTRDGTTSHPWHHGLWFTIKFVNGENFWEEIEPFGTLHHAAAPAVDGPTLTGGVRWVRPDGSVIVEEQRRLTHVDVAPDAYALDLHLELTARAAVELDRTPYVGWGGYSGLTYRGRDDLDAKFLLDGDTTPRGMR